MKLIKSDGMTFLLRNKKKIIGGCWCVIKNETLKIEFLFIKEEFRNAGLSQLLMKKIEGKARHANCREITLAVLKTLSKAVHVYRKNNFKEYSNAGEYFLMKKILY